MNDNGMFCNDCCGTSNIAIKNIRPAVSVNNISLSVGNDK